MAIATLSGAAAACSDSGTEPKDTGAAAGVEITPEEARIAVGATTTLSVTVRDAQGNEVRGAQIFWSSADTAIATVSPEGVVQAKKAGTVKIAASFGGNSDVATIIISPQAVAAVTLSQTTASLTVGGSVQLSATATAPSGEALTDRQISWKSSNEAVATVDQTGRVTAISPGAASITATSEGRSASAAVTVSAVAIAAVSVTPTAVNLTVGQTTQLDPTVTDANGAVVNDRPVTWTSSNNAVATVSSSGLAIALAVGSATLTASLDGKSASVAVTVSPVPVSAVVVSPSPTQLTVGQSVTLSVQVTDATGKIVNPPKSYSSDAPAIATVDQAGVVRGVAPGTTTVRVTAEGKVGTTTVVVSAVPVASVVISPKTASLTVGGTTKLSATARDAGGATLSGRQFTFTSSNGQVASVTNDGVVTAVAAGTAVIFAESEGQRDEAIVTVTRVPVGSVTVSPSAASITVGQTTQLSRTVRDANGTVVNDREVTWTSSNTQVALVSGAGLVTGVNVGNATITATSEGKSGSAQVSVTAIPVASVTVALASISLTVGQTTQATPTVRDASGNVLTGRLVTWTTSNAAVATVSNDGVVTAVGAGTATITGTSEGKPGSATVTVTAPASGVASVSVTPVNPTVKENSDLTLTAVCRDAAANALTGRPITWSTNVSGMVASLSTTTGPTTVLRAKKEAKVTVTATCEGKTGTTIVTIND